jgi:hypothetical protein
MSKLFLRRSVFVKRFTHDMTLRCVTHSRVVLADVLPRSCETGGRRRLVPRLRACSSRLRPDMRQRPGRVLGQY